MNNEQAEVKRRTGANWRLVRRVVGIVETSTEAAGQPVTTRVSPSTS